MHSAALLYVYGLHGVGSEEVVYDMMHAQW